MSWQAIVQALVLVVLLVATVPLLGRYMADVYGARNGRLGTGRSVLRPDRAVHLPVLSDRPEARAALERVRRIADRVQRRVVPRASTRLQRLQGSLPFNPTDRSGVVADGCVQRRDQLRHQHQLAVVLGRVDDEPPHPDGRLHRPELRVGGGRHGGRDRPDPRHHPHRTRATSATSGSTSSGRSCGSCCRSRLVFTVVLMSQGVVQNLTGDTIATRRSIQTTEITEQHIPGGPFASQEAIKELGTNGGGSSTPTRPTRSRTRTGSPTCSRSSRSC